jgi:ribosomal protein S6--L-glutamate ligase
MTKKTKAIALEARLRNCKNVVTLGVRANFSDYSPQEAELIRKADKIYYPTPFYADLFDAMGKATFPSYHVFYGKRQKSLIPQYFEFPFIAKIARGSAMGRGVYFIRNEKELSNYFDLTSPAYIQEYLPIDRDIRVVVIGDRIVHAYWRIAPQNEYRSNVAVGGTIDLDGVPEKACNLALRVARACRWDDVGIDICEHNGQFYVLEANMKYGREGFRKAGLDYDRLMESMIENEEI